MDFGGIVDVPIAGVVVWAGGCSAFVEEEEEVSMWWVELSGLAVEEADPSRAQVSLTKNFFSFGGAFDSSVRLKMRGLVSKGARDPS